MAAVIVHNDSGAQENKICNCFHFSPSICHEVMGPDAMIFVFQCWVLSQPFHSPLSPSSRGSFLLLLAITVVSSAYLRLLILLLAILILVCDSYILAFAMMYSTYKLNKSDNIQPWHTPFPIWNQSFAPCQVLAVTSWPAYIFLRRHVR